MKKIKIVSALLALMLCTSVALVSCDSSKKDNIKTVGIEDVMNPDWEDEKSGAITSYTNLNYMGVFDKNQSKGDFIITTEQNLSDPDDSENNGQFVKQNLKNTRIYNVKSMNNGTLVFTDTITVDQSLSPALAIVVMNYVHVISSDYVAVLTVTTKGMHDFYDVTSSYFGAPLSNNFEYSLSIYDASNTIKETFYHGEILGLCENNMSNFDKVYGGDSDIESSLIYKYLDASALMGSGIYGKNSDLFAIGGKVYRVNEDMKAELVCDYGIAARPEVEKMVQVGENYIISSTGTYTVYDNELNVLWRYDAPGYANNCDAYVLSNGALLVQYIVQLDQNAKDFDLRYGADGKYDLVTLIVNKKGTTEITDANYLIESLEPSVEDADGKMVYDDKVDNLAFIYPIGEDKMPDQTEANKKLVLLSNDGEIEACVEAEGGIADYPIHYANGYYAVELLDGSCAIYDKEGEKISALVFSAFGAKSILDKYLLLDNVIYDAEGKVIYDANKDHATALPCGNTVIIRKYSATAVAYGIFINGNVMNIGTVSAIPNNSTIDDFGYDASGYYYTYNKQNDKYTYFNEMGNAIGMFNNKLTLCTTGDGFAVMADIDIFYKFNIAK